MLNRNLVYQVLDEERAYQKGKWGENELNNTIENWLVYLDKYLAKAKEASQKPDVVEFLNNIRNVTALGVAVMEQYGAVRRE